MLFALAAFTATLIVALDRATKLWLMRLPDPEPFSLSWLITRTHHQNHGLIANLAAPQWAIICITLLVLPLIGTILYQSIKQRRVREIVALSMVTGGAISNLWDRIAWGYVFDWILVYHLSILNLADIAIGAGLLWYVLEHLAQEKQRT